MSRAVSGGSGGGLGRALGILALVVIGLLVLASLMRGMATVAPQGQALATGTPGTQCPATANGMTVFPVKLSHSSYPESTDHIQEARTHYGKPYVLTLDRPGADLRRADATRNFPRVSGQEPDEYPPAIALEGGVNANVKNIDASDNHRSGASMGNQLRGKPDGTLFCIEITP